MICVITFFVGMWVGAFGGLILIGLARYPAQRAVMNKSAEIISLKEYRDGQADS